MNKSSLSRLACHSILAGLFLAFGGGCSEPVAESAAIEDQAESLTAVMRPKQESSNNVNTAADATNEAGHQLAEQPTEQPTEQQRQEKPTEPWRLPVAPAEGVMVPLVYTSNLNGELEPCGCTVETDYGGIQRRAEAVRRLRKTFKSTDDGILLLSAGGLLDNFGASEAIKNTSILKGMQAIGYDGIGVQPRDLMYGVEFISGKSLPWINSTLLPAASLPDTYKESSGEVIQPFADHIVLHRANTDFAIFSILPESGLFAMSGKSGDKADYAALMAKMKEKMHNDNIVILMSAVPAKQLKQYIDLQWVDILITPAGDEYFKSPQWLKNTLWLQPGHRGMRMGVAQLQVSGEPRKPLTPDPHTGLNLNVKSYRSSSESQLTLLSHEVIALDNQVPNDPAMAQWYAAYNEAVAKDYEERSALQKKYQAGAEQVYLGFEVCAGCHQSVVDNWLQTDHSQAIQTLEDKNKAFDPACLKCHTVAFHKPGGFIDMEVTEHLANVQCENCHANTAEHVKDPAVKKPSLVKASPPDVCVQCHNKTHSPSFNFDAYWPRIAHDLQGAIQAE